MAADQMKSYDVLYEAVIILTDQIVHHMILLVKTALAKEATEGGAGSAGALFEAVRQHLKCRHVKT